MLDINELFTNNAPGSGVDDVQWDRSLLLEFFNATFRVSPQSAFIIDFAEHKMLNRTENLIYIDESVPSDINWNSPNPYWSRVNEDTLRKLIDIRRNYPLVSEDLSVDQYQRHVCTIDYPIVINNRQLYISQRFTPLLLDKDGISRIGLFIVSSSTKTEMECSIFLPDGRQYIFDFRQRKFLENTKDSELSKKELAILRRIKMGLTNQEIADSMYLSVNTVKTHRARIFKKLGVNNITEAIAVVENYVRKE